MTYLSFHESHIHLVLQRLLENTFFVSVEKCELHPLCLFIGQIRAVNDWPTPTRSSADASSLKELFAEDSLLFTLKIISL